MSSEAAGWEAAYRKRAYAKREPHEDIDSLDQTFRKEGVRRILDLGCGDGRHLVYFARRGYEMCGLDSAPTAVSLADEWLAKEGLSAQLVSGDMSAIPWPDAFFDAVICVQTINHQLMASVERTISGIWRVLCPGGWLFLTVSTDRPTGPVTNGREVEPNTYVLLSGHEKGVPHHFFDMEELLELLVAFEIVDQHKDTRDYTCSLARKPKDALGPERGHSSHPSNC